MTGSQKHRDPRFLPFAFTEHGAIMAATILNSPRAVEMSLYVVRAFVQLREFLASNAELARKLTELERNGAPIVLRLDRAKAHRAPAVRAVLEAHGVLALHGPPRYPRFYGQLERQNREHRQWMARFPRQRRALLEPCLTEMLYSVNALWRRRTLGWKTAAEVWNARPTLAVDRAAFREEVHERARAIAHRLKCKAQPGDLAERLAIERTLKRMGYLRQEIGGWC